MTNFLNFCFSLWWLFCCCCFHAQAMYVQLHVKYLVCSDNACPKRYFIRREKHKDVETKIAENQASSPARPPPPCAPPPKVLSGFLLDTQGKRNTQVRQRRLWILKDSGKTVNVYLRKSKKVAQERQVSSGNIPLCTWWGFNKFRHHRPPWEVRCGSVSTPVETQLDRPTSRILQTTFQSPTQSVF